MSNDPVRQAILELQDIVKCRCDPAYKSRGLHAPECNHDGASEVEVVANRIAELEADLATVVEALKVAHQLRADHDKESK